MSANREASRTRRNFYELVVEGSPERTSGILIGLKIAAQDDVDLYFSYEEGVSCSLGERLRGMVGAAAVHAIIDSSMRTLVNRHRRFLEKEHGVTIVEEKRIRSAGLDFRYHAYARKYGEEIKKLLGSLPSGVKVEGGAPEETIDETARGVEAYSATHHYEVEGKGKVTGRVDVVIEVRKLLDAHPLVDVGSVELDFA